MRNFRVQFAVLFADGRDFSYIPFPSSAPVRRPIVFPCSERSIVCPANPRPPFPNAPWPIHPPPSHPFFPQPEGLPPCPSLRPPQCPPKWPPALLLQPGLDRRFTRYPLLEMILLHAKASPTPESSPPVVRDPGLPPQPRTRVDHPDVNMDPYEITHAPLLLKSMPVTQLAVLMRLWAGESVSSAASSRGLHPSTIYRWMHNDPKFIAAMNQSTETYLKEMNVASR